MTTNPVYRPSGSAARRFASEILIFNEIISRAQAVSEESFSYKGSSTVPSSPTASGQPDWGGPALTSAELNTETIIPFWETEDNRSSICDYESESEDLILIHAPKIIRTIKGKVIAKGKAPIEYIPFEKLYDPSDF